MLEVEKYYTTYTVLVYVVDHYPYRFNDLSTYTLHIADINGITYNAEITLYEQDYQYFTEVDPLEWYLAVMKGHYVLR
jgi:hypothetical protein